MATKPVKKVDPKTTRLLAQKFQQLSELMKKADVLTAKLAPVQEQIVKLREDILKQFTDEELQSTTAGGLRVSRAKLQVPKVLDDQAFMAYATKKQNWDLLSHKPAARAWRERLDQKVLVPGTKAETVVHLQVTKVKS
jgi:hypothetical protein